MGQPTSPDIRPLKTTRLPPRPCSWALEAHLVPKKSPSVKSRDVTSGHCPPHGKQRLPPHLRDHSPAGARTPSHALCERGPEPAGKALGMRLGSCAQRNVDSRQLCNGAAPAGEGSPDLALGGAAVRTVRLKCNKLLRERASCSLFCGFKVWCQVLFFCIPGWEEKAVLHCALSNCPVILKAAIRLWFCDLAAVWGDRCSIFTE